jgi:hypothetical protein
MKDRNKVRAVGVAVLAILGTGVAATACASPGPAVGNSGTPQNPCHGTASDCQDSDWYVTTVNVNGRQVECITQDTSGTGYQMSCDWPEKVSPPR